jgi:DNA helicase II / ATP-dependent DNA helicase PcrA
MNVPCVTPLKNSPVRTCQVCIREKVFHNARLLLLQKIFCVINFSVLNLSSLNPQQRLAAETLRGPVLILAGAGTGKTRVITFRIAYMIERGISPGNILGVTFTNKAAREMQERVKKLIPKRNAERGTRKAERETRDPKADRPTICTFHSLCVRILRQHIEKLGYKRNFVIYDESEQIGAVKKILAQISAKGEKTDPHAILSLLSRYKNGGERSAAFGDESVRAMAEHIRKRYESALHACNAVDFDDLILLTLRLFKEHPDALEACRTKFRYVMVDEYQDTNAAQFELVQLLTQEHRNLCVVGDDDQSIYGWRGAEISNLLDMEKHFPEVKVIKLEQNYRSTNTILRAANTVIKNNLRRRGKQLWSDKGDGSKIILHTFADDEEEARTIVEQINYARIARRVPWGDNAILFRTNQQSRPLETALRTAGVRYHLIGGQSFFDRREIRDFLAYLKTFLNPHDDVSLLRIANTPARGLSDVTMERLLAASHERKESVFAAMKNPAVTTTFQTKTRESIEAFVEFVERTQAMLHGSTTETSTVDPQTSTNLSLWAEAFLEEIAYFNELRRGEKNPDTADNRIRNLKELMVTMEHSGSATQSPSERLHEFLEDITLDSDREQEEEKAGDAVTLITMHSCKGLEFPHVYVVGLEEGLLPHSRSKVEGTLDEERRLFYVAITRAMQSLSISHCGGRKKYGQLLPCHPSQFLKELPPELIEHADEKAKTPVAAESGKDMFAAMRDSLG